MRRTARVIEFPKPRKVPKPRPFGTVVARGGRLSIKFRYFGEYIQRAIDLKDTAGNRDKARTLLDEIGKAIRAGTFRFADVFPGASEEEKERFATLEGQTLQKGPGAVTFGEYVDQWTPKHLDTERSATKQRDYRSVIHGHPLPRFGALPFDRLTGVEVVDFVRSLGDLSPSRIRNILIPLRVIWEDAVEEHGWELRNPFDHLKRRNRSRQLIPARQKNPPEVFRFADWQQLIEAMDDWHAPIAEVMLMTGAIHSEMARMRCEDIAAPVLPIRGTKTQYRAREIPITAPLRERLETLADRARGDSLVTLPDGTPWAEAKAGNVRFRNGPWWKAFRETGLPYRRPYAMRHTFAAWNLLLGVHPNRVVRLMGHGSKQMVYEVYGNYVEGLEDDLEAIGSYLGLPKKKPPTELSD